MIKLGIYGRFISTPQQGYLIGKTFSCNPPSARYIPDFPRHVRPQLGMGLAFP